MSEALNDLSSEHRAPPISMADALIFKVIFVVILFSCSITLFPINFGVTKNSSNLLYFDTPFVILLAFWTFVSKSIQGINFNIRAIRPFLPMFLLIIWWGISGIVYAKNEGFFFISFLQFAMGGLFVISAPWPLVRYRLVGFAMDSVLVVSILVSLGSIVQSIWYPIMIFEAITSTLSANHAHIGLYMLVSLSMALHRLMSQKGRQVLPSIAALLSFYSVLASGSRAGLMGGLIVLAFYFFQKLSVLNFLKLLAGASLMIGIIMFIGNQRTTTTQGAGEFEVSKGVKIDQSAGRRMLIWFVSWKVINSSPEKFIKGVGFTNFRWEYGKSIKLPFYVNAAHNAFLHIWVESGIIGLILYLWMLISIAWRGWNNRKRDPPATQLIALCLGVFVTAFTQETLYPNESFCNFNVFFVFSILLMVLHSDFKPTPAK